MAVVTMNQLLGAGMHFGHQTRKWDPRMKKYISGERNGIYIVDLRKTLAGIEQAYTFLRDLVARGGIVLFVGTKRHVQDAMAASSQACGMPYVNERWLGGMLTNFATVSGRLRKLSEFENSKAAGELEGMPKRELLQITRQMDKLRRNLGGIRNLGRAPDALFIIDTNKEHLAITEANKLGIPVVAVVDTNCDPEVVDFPIPGNDDAIRGAELMCRVMSEAILEGRYIASKTMLAPPEGAAAGPPARHATPPRAGTEPASPVTARVAAPVEAPGREPSAAPVEAPGGGVDA